MSNVKIGLAQVRSKLGDVKWNLSHHLEYINRAKREDVDILAFPELSLTGYMIKDLVYELADDCRKALVELEKSSKDICVLAGFVEEVRPGIYQNSMAVICDGKFLGTIPKLYLPNYGLFEESKYFKSGSAGQQRIFTYKGLGFGAVICEDAWHPEPVELLARLGADLVFVASSSPLRGLYGSCETRIEEIWHAINVTRAVENTVYVAFVNRVGPEDEEYFWGGSMLISPEGEVLARGRKMEEDLVIAQVSVHVLRRARRFSSFKEHKVGAHRILGELL